MGLTAMVATTYHTEWDAVERADVFDWWLRKVQDNPDYEDIIQWNNEDHSCFELNRSMVGAVRTNAEFDDAVCSIAEDLLRKADPDNDFIRVELY